MTNNTATLPVNNANVMSATLLTPEQANVIMQYIMSGKAIVIIPNGDTFNLPISVQGVEVPTVIKPKRVFNIDKYYETRLNNLLERNDIVHEGGKGAKFGTIRNRTYNYLLKKAKKERSFRRVKSTLSILCEAGMKEEGRGLKYDIVKDVYTRLPKASYYSNKKYAERKEQEIIAALKDLPLTNDFPRKMDKFMNDKLNDVIEVTAIS